MRDRVCLIIPSMRHGGAERVMSVLANEWSNRDDLDVYLILLTKQKVFYNLDTKIKVIEPERGYSATVAGKFFYSIWILKYIRKKVAEIHPRSILSFCERYNNLVLLACMGLPYKLFISDRSNPDNNLGLLHESLRSILYKKARGIIAQTKKGKEILNKKTGNSRIFAVPNPLRNVETSNKASKEKVILNVGRNVASKSQLELIEIFSTLSNAEEWKLLILGEGPQRPFLIARIEELNLQSRVLLLDFQEDVDFYYRQASIFAFPSLYEGFPNALSEAMAHGLACIAYDCPTGPAEIIENDKNGFLIQLKDEVDFKQKLQILIDDDVKRETFSKNAFESSKRFSSEHISREYLKIILDK